MQRRRAAGWCRNAAGQRERQPGEDEREAYDPVQGCIVAQRNQPDHVNRVAYNVPRPAEYHEAGPKILRELNFHGYGSTQGVTHRRSVGHLCMQRF